MPATKKSKNPPVRIKTFELTVREVRVWKCRIPASRADVAMKKFEKEHDGVECFPYNHMVLEVEDIKEVVRP